MRKHSSHSSVPMQARARDCAITINRRRTHKKPHAARHARTSLVNGRTKRRMETGWHRALLITDADARPHADAHTENTNNKLSACPAGILLDTRQRHRDSRQRDTCSHSDTYRVRVVVASITPMQPYAKKGLGLAPCICRSLHAICTLSARASSMSRRDDYNADPVGTRLAVVEPWWMLKLKSLVGALCANNSRCWNVCVCIKAIYERNKNP